MSVIQGVSNPIQNLEIKTTSIYLKYHKLQYYCYYHLMQLIYNLSVSTILSMVLKGATISIYEKARLF